MITLFAGSIWKGRGRKSGAVCFATPHHFCRREPPSGASSRGLRGLHRRNHIFGICNIESVCLYVPPKGVLNWEIVPDFSYSYCQAKPSHGRYNLMIQSMIEFCLKMIQFNFWFKRKLWKMIQFNFQFKRKLSGFNSKKVFNQKEKNQDSIQKILNSKLFLANSIQ